MKIHAFIPARYGSTRFPGKPLAAISGKPMIQHVYERASSCPGLEAVVVATDDERIVRCVEDFGGRAVMTRRDHASGTDRICEAAQILAVKGDDVVVNIQGDQPLFPPELLTLLTAPFFREEGILMSTLKRPIKEASDLSNPNHVKVVTDRQGFAIYFSRHPIPFVRDPEQPGVHFKHLGVYAYRMDFLVKFTSLPEGVLERVEKLEQLRVLENGYRIRVMETEIDSPEVDVPADVQAVEAAMTAR